MGDLFIDLYKTEFMPENINSVILCSDFCVVLPHLSTECQNVFEEDLLCIIPCCKLLTNQLAVRYPDDLCQSFSGAVAGTEVGTPVVS
jgi:hypothetical protein